MDSVVYICYYEFILTNISLFVTFCKHYAHIAEGAVRAGVAVQGAEKDR